MLILQSTFSLWTAETAITAIYPLYQIFYYVSSLASVLFWFVCLRFFVALFWVLVFLFVCFFLQGH